MKLPGINEIILKHVKKDSYQKYLDLVPNIKSDKNEKLLTVILTLFASILLGVFAINPTISTIANLQKQLEDDKFVEARLQEKINNLSALDQKYQDIQKDLPLIYDAIPQTPEIATLAAILHQILNTDKTEISGLETFQVELSKEALAKKKYSTYQFNVSAKGNYQDLTSLLDRLINFQRIITVDKISITKQTKEANLLFNLTGTVYFKK